MKPTFDDLLEMLDITVQKNIALRAQLPLVTDERDALIACLQAEKEGHAQATRERDEARARIKDVEFLLVDQNKLLQAEREQHEQTKAELADERKKLACVEFTDWKKVQELNHILREGWKCFHCGTFFSDRTEAQEHFGERGSVVSCVEIRAEQAEANLAECEARIAGAQTIIATFDGLWTRLFLEQGSKNWLEVLRNPLQIQGQSARVALVMLPQGEEENDA